VHDFRGDVENPSRRNTFAVSTEISAWHEQKMSIRSRERSEERTMLAFDSATAQPQLAPSDLTLMVRK
jgi:hypothetical protein